VIAISDAKLNGSENDLFLEEEAIDKLLSEVIIMYEDRKGGKKS